MRAVTIYTNNGATLVGNAYRQLAGVKLNRAPVIKSYTMADGSPCIYTAAKDKATVTIELECSQAAARALASYAHNAEFTFQGLNVIGNASTSTALHCYLTGGIGVELISEAADLCKVSVPVQILYEGLVAT